MLHTRFRENQPTCSGEEDFLKVFTIYGHGGHLGHVTRIIFTNFHFLVQVYLIITLSLGSIETDRVISETVL